MSYLAATHPEGVFALAYRGLRLFFAGFFTVFFLMVIAIAGSFAHIIAVISSSDGILAAYKNNFFLMDMGLLIGPLCFYANFIVINNIENNTPESLVSCLWVPVQKFFCIIGVNFLLGLLISAPLAPTAMIAHTWQDSSSGGIVAVIGLGVFTYLVFLVVLALPILLTEDESIISCITKSASLVYGNWWRTFIVILLPAIYSLIIFMVIAFIYQIIFHPLAYAPSVGISDSELSIFISCLALFIGWEIATVIALLHDLELRD